MLAQSIFVDLGQQTSNDITFLLPKIPSTSTELHFDEATTWYRLADEMFLHFAEQPRVLGVQCRTLFEKPKRDPLGTFPLTRMTTVLLISYRLADKLITEILPVLLPMFVVLGMFFAFSLVKN
jgi:hypothetical protein